MALFQFVAVLMLSLFAAPVPQMSKQSNTVESEPCAKAMTQMDLDDCWGRQYKKADAHLNLIYRKVLQMMEKDIARDKFQKDADMLPLDQTALLDLKKTERLWIRYRASQCEAAQQQNAGGSMAPMTWAICMMDVTEDRVKELKDTYETPDRKLE
jgi:uncharacterized protein YecT (DUF1311 family)